ncbi:DUF937 domain-containing protein [Deinococcus sp.]|uniref:DUF937 domain-containing protein n=1 Tax=Deinococcus sp. TaxID=47478 RepID=UPI003CC5C152
MNILELLKAELGGAVMDRLGGALGLSSAQAQAVGEHALPTQLAALSEQARLPGGSQRLLDLAAQVPAGSAQELVASESGVAQVRQLGASLLPQVLGGGAEAQVQRIATQTGVSGGSVQGLMQMILPLVLGFLGRHVAASGLNAGNLGSLFDGVPGLAGLGGLGAGLRAAAAGTLGAAAGTVVIAPSSQGAAVTPPLPTEAGYTGPTGTMPHANTSLGRRPGLGWLWMLPLLLLLLLGGCWLLGGKPSTPFTVISPVGGTSVSANAPFTVKGTGKAGETVTLSEKGAALASGKVADDGSYSLNVPSATVGDHSYSLAQSGDDKPLDLKLSATHSFSFTTPSSVTAVEGTGKPGDVLEVFENGASLGKVTVGADGKWSLNLPNIAQGDHTFIVKGPSGAELGTLKTTLALPAAGTAAGNGNFALSFPAANATLPAGAFTMKGNGKAGDALQVFEDGTSLGNVTVGADGTWSLDVPSPTAGAHTYSVKGPGGAELGSVKATVAAAAANAGATCTKTFSLSIKDGQTVSAPYRFGGVGSGKSYDITVLRGAKKIGSKNVPLDATCGWSYTSNPGKGTITYSISESGKTDVAGKITLTVK